MLYIGSLDVALMRAFFCVALLLILPLPLLLHMLPIVRLSRPLLWPPQQGPLPLHVGRGVLSLRPRVPFSRSPFVMSLIGLMSLMLPRVAS